MLNISSFTWDELCLPSGEVGTCCFTFVCSVSPLSLCLCVFSVCMSHSIVYRRSNTRRWPNAGLMLAHHLRRWPNISPVLGYCVVFGATLNVGQRHRQQANIHPALGQSWYRQHEVLTKAEWILPSTGDAGLTFVRHWIDGSLYSVNTPPPT